MINGINGWTIAFAAALLMVPQFHPAHGQEAYYKGKTIRLIVGLAPGGGFDTYSRVIARHIGKHIPGTPAMVVDNM
ncbi:MAG: Bug family tripartite tricarboxylate transporter substrate binding protein, partial [Candidatus Binatia bacterium]